ncbi:MAG TPA: BatA domain-containing protein [Pyrinomonadaceae bacterium]
MRFLSPLALFGLALIALPIAIHLLVRRQAARLDFPSLRFLRETPSFRLRPRRIQQPLLLALRVAALALLIIAFARPLISSHTRTARAHVILLDASLSMQAVGRVEAAKEQARAVVNNLAPGERAAIISFSNDATVLSAMTSDKRSLDGAIERFEATSGAADYAAGFAAAEALLHNEPPAEISLDLISDFQASGLRKEFLPQVDKGARTFSQLITHPVGEELERNAFLNDVAAQSAESMAEISATEIIAARGERRGARLSWKLDSSEAARADIEWRTQSNGQITAHLRTLAPDDFDADDERFVSFAAPRKGRALLIERDADDAVSYLRAALETVADEKHFALERKASLPASASELNDYSLVTLVMHGAPRADELRALADYVRAGGLVWLCAGRDVDTAAWNEFAKSKEASAYPFTSLARKNDEHQALSFGAADADARALSFAGEGVLTALRAVRMHEGYAVTPRDEAATLMRWNDGAPAFVSKETGSGSILLFATSPARAAGELGVSPSFPALASSIARASLTPREPLSREIGEPVKLNVSPDEAVKIFDAGGKTTSARARDLITRPQAFFPRAGIYRVESNNFNSYLAFNAPAAESETALAHADDIARLFKLPEKGANETPQTAWHEATERRGNLWRYFLLAAFVLLIVEMFVAMRHGRGMNRDGQDEQELKI